MFTRKKVSLCYLCLVLSSLKKSCIGTCSMLTGKKIFFCVTYVELYLCSHLFVQHLRNISVLKMLWFCFAFQKWSHCCIPIRWLTNHSWLTGYLTHNIGYWTIIPWPCCLLLQKEHKNSLHSTQDWLAISHRLSLTLSCLSCLPQQKEHKNSLLALRTDLSSHTDYCLLYHCLSCLPQQKEHKNSLHSTQDWLVISHRLLLILSLS